MMNHNDWNTVLPAITTPFTSDDRVDHGLLAAHAAWMVECGCGGIVALGSLGEGGALDRDERSAVLTTIVKAVGGKAPVVAGISSVSTRAAAAYAKDAAACGCRGLMVLPPYAYKGPWSEMREHFGAVIGATGLSCMLYNNPIAYGTDVLPEQLAELAASHANLQAVKESSADVRRVTAIRALMGERLAVLVGVDDLIVEAIGAGATGWVAGLVNAFPAESVALFRYAMAGQKDKAAALYQWFLPLLRMDVVPEFVHLIKLVQQEMGHGSERVRGPRRPLSGAAREAALATLKASLKSRPAV
ncbi:MAG: dihydrodipicolinate synthase family protein [Planctomycetes bacterium]|nr:dihydrodipicolinate synthase family protein [Planctomycetota bacterium]